MDGGAADIVLRAAALVVGAAVLWKVVLGLNTWISIGRKLHHQFTQNGGMGSDSPTILDRLVDLQTKVEKVHEKAEDAWVQASMTGNAVLHVSEQISEHAAWQRDHENRHRRSTDHREDP